MVSPIVLISILLLTAAVHSVSAKREIRLVGGDTINQGRVEVLVKRKWSTICDNRFSLSDAHVICRMLGYPSAQLARHGSFYGPGKGDIWIDQLGCTGREDSIFDCDMSELGVNTCDHGDDAGVVCYRHYAPSVPSLPVRLTCPYNQTCNNIARKRGPDPGECTPSVHVEGIVEVYYNERWWPVSADEWDDEDVNVVCGQLGYPVSFGTVSKLAKILPKRTRMNRQQKKQFKATYLQKVLMVAVACAGTEGELRFCPHYGWGPFDNPDGKVATARCGFHPHPSCDGECQHQPSYRLRSGAMPWMGRVEVLYDNQWGTICDVGFSYNSANVLCRSLGYGTASTITERSGYGRGIGEVWLSHVKCDGTERWLHDCQHSPWRRFVTICDNHVGDVGVVCNAPDIYYDQPSPVQFIETDNARDLYYGHYVEVSGDGGEVGLLCYDDETDVMMATVLCRSLPNPSFLSTFQASGLGSYKGQRYSGKFVCNGNEMNIRECDMEFNPVPSCSRGDLLIRCDKGAADLVPILSKLRQSLKSSLAIHPTPVSHLVCARQEGCLASGADNASYTSIRTLLRFDSLTMNYGAQDFTPLLNPSEWEWHACHHHYHSFDVFVEYDLLDLNGTKVAEGHKASFCLEDTVCDIGGHRRHSCITGIQGISKNCGDLYARHLDCQWIDITGVPSGTYNLQLSVNPSQLAVESDYRNNIIQCMIRLSVQGQYITTISCLQSDHEAPTC